MLRFKRHSEHKAARTKKKLSTAHTNQTRNVQGKERLSRAAREKDQVTQRGRPIRLIADFSGDFGRQKGLGRIPASSK